MPRLLALLLCLALPLCAHAEGFITRLLNKPVPGGVAVIELGDDVSAPQARYQGKPTLVVREDGCVLLRQRPDKGLLAKMLEVPSIGWLDGKYTAQSECAPLETQWQQVPGIVTHTFTHFHLQLDVRLAHVAVDQLLLAGADHRCFRWVLRKELSAQALPGVMRKILSHGLGEPL